MGEYTSMEYMAPQTVTHYSDPVDRRLPIIQQRMARHFPEVALRCVRSRRTKNQGENELVVYRDDGKIFLYRNDTAKDSALLTEITKEQEKDI